eukprot:4540730-Prymnesium_polylepis.1
MQHAQRAMREAQKQADEARAWAEMLQGDAKAALAKVRGNAVSRVQCHCGAILGGRTPLCVLCTMPTCP